MSNRFGYFDVAALADHVAPWGAGVDGSRHSAWSAVIRSTGPGSRSLAKVLTSWTCKRRRCSNTVFSPEARARKFF